MPYVLDNGGNTHSLWKAPDAQKTTSKAHITAQCVPKFPRAHTPDFRWQTTENVMPLWSAQMHGQLKVDKQQVPSQHS